MIPSACSWPNESQIADDLFISLNTVSYHLRNIFAKTSASMVFRQPAVDGESTQ